MNCQWVWDGQEADSKSETTSSVHINILTKLLWNFMSFSARNTYVDTFDDTMTNYYDFDYLTDESSPHDIQYDVETLFFRK